MNGSVRAASHSISPFTFEYSKLIRCTSPTDLWPAVKEAGTKSTVISPSYDPGLPGRLELQKLEHVQVKPDFHNQRVLSPAADRLHQDHSGRSRLGTLRYPLDALYTSRSMTTYPFSRLTPYPFRRHLSSSRSSPHFSVYRMAANRNSECDHTTAEWEAHKDLFSHYYAEEHRPLHQVRDIMEFQHGFCAT